MTHTVFDLEKIFRKAAGFAISEWSRPFDEADELKQKLWEWYLKRPSTQEKLQDKPPHEVVNMVKRVAIQILSEDQAESNQWAGLNHYDSQNVKDALLGESFNPYLALILPDAFKALEAQNAGYAAAIRSRYFDHKIPQENGPKQKLKWAVKALTEHVNRIAITAEMQRTEGGGVAVADGPGSKRIMQKKRFQRNGWQDSSMSPDLIRSKGEHGDPTANTALMLMANEELKEEYLYETPLEEFLRGSGA